MTAGAMEIGHVTSVSGAKVTGILVNSETGQESVGPSDLNRGVQIGALVKMRTPCATVFGVVAALSIREPCSPPRSGEARIVEIDLFGEAETADTGSGQFAFARGVSTYPGLGDPIHAATPEELARIYAEPSAAHAQFGTLYQDHSLPVHFLTDELLSKHFAILGTTGSGKSCALAVVLRSILDSSPCGHIVLLDPHNEYGRAFADRAEVVTPENLDLPYWLLNFEELIEVLCSSRGPSRESEAHILKQAILDAKRDYLGANELAEYLTVDTPVPYRLGALLQSIDDLMGKLDKPDQVAPYLRLTTRIESLRADRRFAFMFSGITMRDNLSDILARILRIPVAGKPITIFDLSGVPSEIIDVMVSLLCRAIFDFGLWSERGKGVPVLLVCEEAHRYIPRDENLGFGPTRKAISRVAKEGRKYGVSLCLVSQRPSELSETILSQCSTIFALRMSSERDQQFVRGAVPEHAVGMLNSLPALRAQEAVVIGEGVTLPMRVRFNDLPKHQRPHGDTAVFSTSWGQDCDDPALIIETIENWRRQTRHSGRAANGSDPTPLQPSPIASA